MDAILGNLGVLPDVPDFNLFSANRPDAGDESLFVTFYMGVIRNEAKSIDEGRPIFDDVECVRIVIPGDKSNIVDHPVSDQDRRRFHKQYGAFKAGLKGDEQLSGTRLSDWPFLTRGQAEEFKHLGIRSVEQLSELRDDLLSRVPGMRQFRDHAKVWLAKTKDTAAASKQAKLMDDQRVRIDTLEQVVRDQADRIEKLIKAADKQAA